MILGKSLVRKRHYEQTALDVRKGTQKADLRRKKQMLCDQLLIDEISLMFITLVEDYQYPNGLAMIPRGSASMLVLLFTPYLSLDVITASS
jgi:hypothetical protein